MKVLSLAQPYASLLFIPSKQNDMFRAKGWETRPWKPKDPNLSIVRFEGMLIHASSSDKYKHVMNKRPFTDYLPKWDDLPFGSVLGWVKVGEILSTESWTEKFNKAEGVLAERYLEEYAFGDYSDNRYAWELKEAKKFNNPIENVKGSLNLWDLPDNLLSLMTI